MIDSKFFFAGIFPVSELINLFVTLSLKFFIFCFLFFHFLKFFWRKVVHCFINCFLSLSLVISLVFCPFLCLKSFKCLNRFECRWLVWAIWFWHSRILLWWILAFAAFISNSIENLLTAELASILENSIGTNSAVGIQISSRATMHAIVGFTFFSIDLLWIKNPVPDKVSVFLQVI